MARDGPAQCPAQRRRDGRLAHGPHPRRGHGAARSVRRRASRVESGRDGRAPRGVADDRLSHGADAPGHRAPRHTTRRPAAIVSGRPCSPASIWPRASPSSCEVARPYLESLVKETGELAALAVELDGVAVCADLVVSARPFVLEIAVGRVIGDTANAHGKMFAAMKPDAERARIARKPHRQLTPATITDPAALAAELERIRHEELAFDVEEHDLGTCAVVAPVRQPDRRGHRDAGRRGPHGSLRPRGENGLRRSGQGHGRRALRVLRVRALEPRARRGRNPLTRRAARICSRRQPGRQTSPEGRRAGPANHPGASDDVALSTYDIAVSY